MGGGMGERRGRQWQLEKDGKVRRDEWVEEKRDECRGGRRSRAHRFAFSGVAKGKVLFPPPPANSSLSLISSLLSLSLPLSFSVLLPLFLFPLVFFLPSSASSLSAHCFSVSPRGSNAFPLIITSFSLLPTYWFWPSLCWSFGWWALPPPPLLFVCPFYHPINYYFKGWQMGSKIGFLLLLVEKVMMEKLGKNVNFELFTKVGKNMHTHTRNGIPRPHKIRNRKPKFRPPNAEIGIPCHPWFPFLNWSERKICFCSRTHFANFALGNFLENIIKLINHH